MPVMSHDLKNLYCFFFLTAFLAPPLLVLCVAYRTCDAPTTEGTRNLGIVGRAALVGVDRLSLASEARHCCVEAIMCGRRCGGLVGCRAHSPEKELEGGRQRRRRDGGIANRVLGRQSSIGVPARAIGMPPSKKSWARGRLRHCAAPAGHWRGRQRISVTTNSLLSHTLMKKRLSSS